MQALVRENLHPLRDLCLKHHVKRLELFGSATRDDFNPERSDLDFLVVFDDVPIGERAEQYFGFLSDLELLFDREIDLTELFAIENPFFLHAIKPTRLLLFDAYDAA